MMILLRRTCFLIVTEEPLIHGKPKRHISIQAEKYLHIQAIPFCNLFFQFIYSNKLNSVIVMLIMITSSYHSHHRVSFVGIARLFASTTKALFALSKSDRKFFFADTELMMMMTTMIQERSPSCRFCSLHFISYLRYGLKYHCFNNNSLISQMRKKTHHPQKAHYNLKSYISVNLELYAIHHVCHLPYHKISLFTTYTQNYPTSATISLNTAITYHLHNRHHYNTHFFLSSYYQYKIFSIIHVLWQIQDLIVVITQRYTCFHVYSLCSFFTHYHPLTDNIHQTVHVHNFHACTTQAQNYNINEITINERASQTS